MLPIYGFENENGANVEFERRHGRDLTIPLVAMNFHQGITKANCCEYTEVDGKQTYQETTEDKNTCPPTPPDSAKGESGTDFYHQVHIHDIDMPESLRHKPQLYSLEDGMKSRKPSSFYYSLPSSHNPTRSGTPKQHCIRCEALPTCICSRFRRGSKSINSESSYLRDGVRTWYWFIPPHSHENPTRARDVSVDRHMNEEDNEKPMTPELDAESSVDSNNNNTRSNSPSSADVNINTNEVKKSYENEEEDMGIEEWLETLIHAREQRRETREQNEESHANCPILNCKLRLAYENRFPPVIPEEEYNVDDMEDERCVEELHRNCPLASCWYKQQLPSIPSPRFEYIMLEEDVPELEEDAEDRESLDELHKDCPLEYCPYKQRLMEHVSAAGNNQEIHETKGLVKARSPSAVVELWEISAPDIILVASNGFQG
ncbi:hypothetical protein BGZ60DRAFT_535259 [Tricladium varicosporioides]|nr:hypothetical protein BGZ60DRAFT_535259 [Hymenoscyphus varicosporioides]